MKRILSLTLAVFLLFSFTSCGSDKKDISSLFIECPVCKEILTTDVVACPECGFGDFNLESNKNLLNDSSFTVLSYLKKSSDKPLILYHIKNIAKDEKVTRAYVITDGKCKNYFCDKTLGELSKMTDDEIIAMLMLKYEEGAEEAISIWRDEYHTNNLMKEGKIDLYRHNSYDISSCLFTDDSGNKVISEMLIFPVRGIGDDPYVIRNNQLSDSDIFNYYDTYLDSDSYKEVKFSYKYFGTGYGTKSDINQINDIFCISDSNVLKQSVYDSTYCGFNLSDDEWSKKDGILCFREPNAYSINISFDSIHSNDINYIDPDENDLLTISRKYYNSYYNSFETLDLDKYYQDKDAEEVTEEVYIVEGEETPIIQHHDDNIE